MEATAGVVRLDEEEEEVLRLPVSRTEEIVIDTRWCLVGKLLTGRVSDFNVFQNMMAFLWQLGMGMYVKELNPNLFLFQFYHEIDIQRVIDGSPWTYDRKPLIFTRLKEGDNPRLVEINHMDMWVQLHNLHSGNMTLSVVTALGNFIGTFIESDPNNFVGVWRDFLRLRASTQRRHSTFGAQWLRSGAAVRGELSHASHGGSGERGVNLPPMIQEQSVGSAGNILGYGINNNLLNERHQYGENIMGVNEEDLTLNVNNNENFFDSTITTIIDSKRRRPDSNVGVSMGPQAKKAAGQGRVPPIFKRKFLNVGRCLGSGAEISLETFVNESTIVKAKFVTQNGVVIRMFQVHNRCWDSDVVKDFFSPTDAAIILGIPIDQSGDVNSWYWAAEKNGFYSVRSAYNLFQDQKHHSANTVSNKFWKILWTLKVPPKAKDLVWRAASNCLATKRNLCIKKVLVESNCPMCDVFAETEWHLLVACDFAWSCFNVAGLAAVARDSFSSLLSWLEATASSVTSEMLGRVIMLCWALWAARNDLVWKQRVRRVSDVVAFANLSLDQWIKAQGKGNLPLLSPLKERDGAEQWIKPSSGIKLNVDAAIFASSFKHGFGCSFFGPMEKF
ncbi:hypothetical protein G4B88_023780 [Cannabis sativa]|uniref:Reverse transcriptase zinc-binding domain-containing protein n=1 Tax=Cannabis sativa TaxID=3483 RepID=A0A7J6HVE8_CANSA|nr:hypothetical protein G4B88_023780 [Cannabis sativa]